MTTFTEQDALEALELTERFPDREDLGRAAAGILKSYKSQQAAAGKPLFPEMKRREQEQWNKLRTHFTDRERHGMDDEAYLDFKTTFRGDAEREARALSNQLLSHVYRRPTNHIRSLGTQYRDEYARAKWGEPVKTWKAFADRLASDFDFEDRIAERARMAAFLETPPLQALGALESENGGNPVYSGRRNQWIDSFSGQAREIRKRISPYRTTVASVVSQLQGKTGTGQTERAMGAAGAKRDPERDDPGSYRDLAEILMGVPKEDRDFVISAIIARGTNGDEAARKFYAKKLAENFGRGVMDYAHNIPAIADRGQALLVRDRIAEGFEVPSENTGTAEGYLRAVTEGVVGGSAYKEARILTGAMGKDWSGPGEDVQAEAAEMAERMVEAVDLRQRLRFIAENDIDPATSENVAARGFLQAARSIPYTLASIAPGGFALNSAMMAETSYQTLRQHNPEMTARQAQAIAGFSGPLQAVVERVSGRVLTGRLPAFQRFANQAVVTQGAAARRFGARLGAAAGIEMVQENVQDITPYFVQGAFSALSQDVPEVPWEDVFGDMARNQTELFFAVLPLALIGAGAGTVNDFRGARDMIGNHDLLKGSGVSEAAASDIRAAAIAGDFDRAQALLRQAHREGGQDQKGMRENIADAIPAMIENRERVRELVNKAGDLDMIPAIRNDGKTWALEFNDGSGMSFDTYEEADSRRWQVAEEEHLSLHVDTVSTIRQIDRDLNEGREMKYLISLEAPTLADKVASGKATEEQALQRMEIAEETGPEIRREFDEATVSAGLAGSTAEDRLATTYILGESVNEFRDEVVRTTVRLYQGATPFTLIEEKAEGDAKFMIQNAGMRRWMLLGLRDWERTTGDRLFRTDDDGSITDQDLAEAWSAMAQSYFVGRSRKGDLGPVMKQGRDQYAKALRSPLGSSLAAYANLLRSVYRRAATVEKARRDGTLDEDLEHYLAKSVGMSEQRIFEREVAKEGAGIADQISPELSDNASSRESVGGNLGETTFSVVADYGIAHRPREDGPRAFDLAEDDMMPSDVYDHPEWYTGMEPKVVRETMEQLRRVRGKPDAELTIFRAAPVGEMNQGDWVSLSKEYARTHAMGIDPEDNPKVWSAKVKAKEVRWSMDDLSEFGYFGETVAAQDAGATFSILPAQGAEYLALAKDPEANREELQAMVDETALRAGYDSGMHYRGLTGTPSEILQSRQDSYVTDVYDIAEEYGPNVQGVYFRATGKKAIIDNKADADLLAEEIGVPFDSDLYVFEWLDDHKVRNALRSAGYSSVTFTDQSPTSYSDHRSVLILDPNQIKSADPVTYDENGNVIPLSQRFDSSRDEITYSILPGGIDLDNEFARMFSPFHRSPVLRAKLGQEMQRRVAGERRKLDEVLRAKRTRANIKREADFREGLEYDRLLREVFGADTQAKQEALPAVDRQAARSDAKSIADKWRAEQEKKLAEVPRATLLAFMRTLDAIHRALPSEVRGRIGGFVALAKLKEPGAMLNEIERRINKVDVELERWLKKEARENLGKVFAKARAKKEAGKRDEGKLGAYGHAWFDYAEEVSQKSPTELEIEIEGLESKLEAEDFSQEDYNFLSDWVGEPVTDHDDALRYFEDRLDIASIIGGTMWGNIGTGEKANRNPLTAEEMSIAVDLARDELEQRRGERKRVVELRRERRAGIRDAMQEALGGPHNDPDRIAEREKDKDSLTRKLEGMFDEGLDYAGFVEDLFGDTEATRKLIAQARRSDQAEKTAMRERKREFANLLRETFPDKNLPQRLHALHSLAKAKDVPDGHIKGKKAHMSELQAVHYTMLAEDESSREWLEGHGYDADLLAQIEQFLSPEAKAIRSWLRDRYEEQYWRINEVYRRIKGVNLPRVLFYAPRLVENMFSSPEMQLGKSGMEGRMETGFTKRRVSMPKGEPVPTDALAAYWSNAFQTEHYIAFAETVGDLRATLGHKDTRLAIEAKRGRKKASQAQYWVQDIDAGGRKNAAANSYMQRILSRMQTALARTALGYKLTTLLKQTPAAVASMSRIGLKEYGKSSARIKAGKGAITLKEMFESDIIQNRFANYETEMRTAINSGQIPSLSLPGVSHFYAEKSLDLGMDALGGVDAGFTTYSAAVAYDAHYRAARAAGQSTADAKAIAWEMAADTVARTAQPDSVINRSQFELSLGNARLLFMFQGPARQQFGMQYLALKQVLRGNGKADDVKTLANAIFVHHILVPSMIQTIGNLMYYLMSDEDWEDVWEVEDYLAAWALGPLSGALWFGPIFEGIANLVGNAPTRLATSPMAVGGEFVWRTAQTFDGDGIDLKDVGKWMDAMSKAIGGDWAAIGVARNVWKQLSGLVKNLTN